MSGFDRESMLEMFVYEMNNSIEQLEQLIINGEDGYEDVEINEIFRIMHTIKGSAAMMMFDNISTTAHKMEDLFFYIREEKPQNVDYRVLTDLVLNGMDFIKNQLAKVQSGMEDEGDPSEIQSKLLEFLSELKKEVGVVSEPVEKKKVKATGNFSNNFEVFVKFDKECEMENVRAYNIAHNLKDVIKDLITIPEDLFDETIIEEIKQNGVYYNFRTNLTYEEIYDIIKETIYLKELSIKTLSNEKTGSEKQVYSANIKYENDSEMENVRAFSLINNINELVKIIEYTPNDLMEPESAEIIKEQGFTVDFETEKSYEEIKSMLEKTIYLRELSLVEKKLSLVSAKEKQDKVENKEKTLLNEENEQVKSEVMPIQKNAKKEDTKKAQPTQTMISVNIGKLDQLLNLMGELVIAEAMVTQNPDLDGLMLENFVKETRHLRKIINDVQDTVMSMRMVPLSPTFFKMHRIVRDMCRALNKDVKLEIIGEETEVDKNIIEHISDPLMHIIRNSIDHGIELPNEREAKGKERQGTVILEAKNSGGDVLIIVRDDGGGLNKDKILAKAKKNNLLKKAENEYSDKEIFQFIFLPGFSTNEVVTGYSGRGVGMDVVTTNIESVGGTILVDSVMGQSSIFTLKIPLTLAIIEGMTIKIGDAKYTIPIIAIKQSFKPSEEDLFTDPSGNEMITVRGECLNVIRLSNFFDIETKIDNVEEGIMIMLENGDQTICLLADELIGEQQVVVKTIPRYLNKTRGISGCTLLGNGDISLIIDVAGFFDK